VPYNPIQYTSRDYAAILADINSDPELIDKPDWFKRCIAGVGDVLSMWENLSANQAFLRTAVSRRAVVDLCAEIDYHLAGRAAATGSILFDVKATASLPATVPAADQAALTRGTTVASSRRFEARSALSVSSLTGATSYTAWSTSTDKVTVAYSEPNGSKIRFSFSATPPTTVPQIVAGVDYYSIYVDATHIRIATSRDNVLSGVYVDITAQGTGTHTITRLSRSATVWQQTSVGAERIGTSDGTTEWQEYMIPRTGVLVDTVLLTINSVAWTRVESLVESLPADTHYRLEYAADGSAIVVFGNGVYGAIPGAFDVMVAYAYSGGTESNVQQIGAISVFAGQATVLDGAWNPAALTGGDNEEDIESARHLGPMLLKARDRFVTVADGEALVAGYGGIETAKVFPNAYGVLSAKVIGVATGGGNPSAGVRSAIETYLIERSVLDSIDVRFELATITPTAATSAAHMAGGYAWADVLPYFRLAWKLVLTETGAEIHSAYVSDGAAAATVKINALLTEAFTDADYVAISTILNGYSRIPPRAFGDIIEESDVITFIQGGVLGVDYMTIAAPGFPVTLATDEITSVGALTLTEIP